jgi:hypothetical protein
MKTFHFIDSCGKRHDRHFENGCDREQATGTDPVRSLFVFLNLLEGDSKVLAEFFL